MISVYGIFRLFRTDGGGFFAQHLHFRQHIGLAVDRSVEQQPHPAAAAAHLQGVAAYRLGTIEYGDVPPRCRIFADLQHAAGRCVHPVQHHLFELLRFVAQIDRNPFPAAGRTHPRAVEMLRGKHRQQLPVAVEEPGLPHDSACLRDIHHEAPSFRCHTLRRFPFQTDAAPGIIALELPHRDPPALRIQALQLRCIGGLPDAFRQRGGQRHRHPVDRLRETVRAQGNLG